MKMGNCAHKPNNKLDHKSISIVLDDDYEHRSGRAGKKSTDSDFESSSLSTSKRAGKLLLGLNGYTDKFIQFHEQGCSVRRLIQQYKAPSDWNDKLKQQFCLGSFQTKNSHGDVIYSRVIHLNDELNTTKRHFLAFYDLDMTHIHPPDFMEWCVRNQMYNTCADYMSLYIISRFHGQGSRILRSLIIDPHSSNIELSDRFQLPNGWVRAVKFSSTTRRGVQCMFNAFMSRLDPQSYRSVRFDKESYPYFEDNLNGTNGFYL